MLPTDYLKIWGWVGKKGTAFVVYVLWWNNIFKVLKLSFFSNTKAQRINIIWNRKAKLWKLLQNVPNIDNSFEPVLTECSAYHIIIPNFKSNISHKF